MAFYLRYFRLTPGDIRGVEIKAKHIILCLCSPFVWFIPARFLSIWLFFQGVLSYFLLRDDFFYCDARLLWEGVYSLSGLTFKQARKQATLTQYIKFQNPCISWGFSLMPYHFWQGVFLIFTSFLLFLLSGSNRFGVNVLLSTPMFIVLRGIPTHDTLAMNLFLSGVVVYPLHPTWSCALFLAGGWCKFYAFGFKRITSNQIKVMRSFITTRDAVYFRRYEERIVRFVTLSFLWSPAVILCNWFTVGFLSFLALRMFQKYYLFLVPLVFL